MLMQNKNSAQLRPFLTWLACFDDVWLAVVIAGKHWQASKQSA